MTNTRSGPLAQIRRFFIEYHRIETVVLIAAIYATLSFVYSFIGFIHPQVGPHFHEYSFPRLAIEIGGHFVFGLIAALPLIDFDLAILTGGTAVLIDADHILSALGLNVSGRPDHSILYPVVSALILFSIGRKLGFDSGQLTKLVSVAPVTLSAHIAYDLFAGPNQEFQFFIPFSFQSFTLPQDYWIVFEVLALLLAGAGYLASRMWSKRRSGMKQLEEPTDHKA